MKKIEYLAPELEVVELDMSTNVLLDSSNPDEIGFGGESDEEEAG